MIRRPLKVVKPQTITDAILVTHSIAEDDAALWNVGTTYAVGTRVMLDHQLYENVLANNVGKNPTTERTAWARRGPTNRWAMFDRSLSSSSRANGPISVQLRPGQAVNGIGLLGLVGDSVRVRIIDDIAGTVYDVTQQLNGVPSSADWWSWFYAQRTPATQSLRLNLPAYPSAFVLIDIAGEQTAIATLLIGQQMEFGLGVQMGAKVGITDYSRKDTDEYGVTEFIERPFSNRASFEVLLDADEVDGTQRFLASVRATPCLWIGSSKYEATTVYGRYSDFNIQIPYTDYSNCSIEIEGLT